MKTIIRSLTLPDNSINNVLCQYLVFHGYAQTLQAIGMDFISPIYAQDPEWRALYSTLEVRSAIRCAIMQGKAEEAIANVQGLFSASPHHPATPIPTHILLPLKCQQWIELVRVGASPDHLISFMQTELGQFDRNTLDPVELDFLEKSLSLLAYEDPLASPFKWLLETDQRDRIADLVNGGIVFFTLRALFSPWEASPLPDFPMGHPLPSSSVNDGTHLDAFLKQLGVCLYSIMETSKQRATIPSSGPPRSDSEDNGITSLFSPNEASSGMAIGSSHTPVPTTGSQTGNSMKSSSGSSQSRSSALTPDHLLDVIEPFIRLLFTL